MYNDETGSQSIKILDKKWYITKKEYIDNLAVMYNKVSEIHRHTESYYFTDHSITHSVRIMDSLEHLFPFLFHDGKAEDMLNDVEKFILFSGILLHDIGIELSAEQKLKRIVEKYKGEKERELVEEFIKDGKKLDYIRKNHHELSKFWIKENVLAENEIDLPKLYVGDKILAKYVANIAESHGKSFEEEKEYTETSAYGNEIIRMGLLCTLLSLGDALDCDQRRIEYDILKSSEISTESRLHWMKHYYVDGIILTSNLIQIYYSFPKCKDKSIQELYQRYFVHKTKYWIEKCFTIRKDFLFPLGAVCRVVDYVKYEDDKDCLTEEELNKVEDYYVDMLLEEKRPLDYLQYAHVLILDGRKKRLFIEGDCRLPVICVPSEDNEKKNVVLSIKNKFELEKEQIEYFGGAVEDRAIHYYYQTTLSSDPDTPPDGLKWKEINEFKKIIGQSGGKYSIKLKKMLSDL